MISPYQKIVLRKQWKDFLFRCASRLVDIRESILTTWWSAMGRPLYVRCTYRFLLWNACYRDAVYSDEPASMPMVCDRHASGFMHTTGPMLRSEVKLP